MENKPTNPSTQREKRMNGKSSVRLRLASSDSSCGCCWLIDGVDWSFEIRLPIGIDSGAFTRDMTGLPTLVANFPSGVQWSSIGGRAVT